MTDITPDFLVNKLKLFLNEEEARKGINESIKVNGFVIQESYSNEDMNKILDSLITKGGYFEFVARNAKIALMVK
ncbi:hypothetical protein ACFL2K_00880 [Candidatus Margulisiibacteriota bacterium]